MYLCNMGKMGILGPCEVFPWPSGSFVLVLVFTVTSPAGTWAEVSYRIALSLVTLVHPVLCPWHRLDSAWGHPPTPTHRQSPPGQAGSPCTPLPSYPPQGDLKEFVCLLCKLVNSDTISHHFSLAFKTSTSSPSVLYFLNSCIGGSRFSHLAFIPIWRKYLLFFQ